MSTISLTAVKGASTWITRPAPDADPRGTTRHRDVGLVLAVAGLVLVAISAVATWGVPADLAAGGEVTGTVAWTFATTVAGFGLAKIGIGITLLGIIVRLWHRANAVTFALPRLRPADAATADRLGPVDTAHGPAVTTAAAPEPLLIHRMAQLAWLPMLAMGAMALAVGLVIGIFAADAEAGSQAFRQLSAWTQGTMFLGEGLLLSGISFLLGTILASLRTAGGEVQQSLGLPVQTLEMPASAKAFIALMATGMMMAIAQFVLYGVAAAGAGDPVSFAAWSTWLGPFRETALGVLLAGIVLALFTISRVLAFQFDRVRDIARPTNRPTA